MAVEDDDDHSDDDVDDDDDDQSDVAVQDVAVEDDDDDDDAHEAENGQTERGFDDIIASLARSLRVLDTFGDVTQKLHLECGDLV